MSTLREVISATTHFLWDFDGCFCDTENIHYQAYQAAFSSFGHTLNPVDYFHSFTHLGGGTEREIETFQLHCSPSQIAEKKISNYANLISLKQPSCFPEILQIVNIQKKLRGIVAIASNSPACEIETILNATRERAQLDLVVGKTDGLSKKPAPDIFLKALELSKGTPKTALVFEDSQRGLEAAAAAGCKAIWVKTTLNENSVTSAPHIARLTHIEILELFESAI